MRAHIGADALRENCATTGHSVASEPSRDDNEPNLPTGQWQIGQAPEIVAVDALSDRRATRTTVAAFVRLAMIRIMLKRLTRATSR